MKKLFLILIIFVFAVGCSEDTFDGSERGSLKGSVRLASTHEPIKNVKITTTPSTLTVYTDEDGNFEILDAIPLGDYSVRADLNGYVTEIRAISLTQMNQTVSVDFEMITDETLNQPPLAPTLISPENMAQNQLNHVLLKWSSSDPDGDTLTYRVLVNNNIDNTQQEFNSIVVDSLKLENLHFGATYTWQVAVTDEINEEVFSSIGQFTVRQNPQFRYHFVQLENGNFVIRSTNLEETIEITNSTTSSWRPLKNNTANRLAFLQTIAGQTNLVTSDLNGQNQQTISQVPIVGFRNEVLNFDWSPDGSQLYFPSLDRLYRVNFNGTGQTQIYQTTTGQFISRCAISYDGSKIAIVTNDNDGYNGKISIIDMNGNFVQTIFEGQPGAVSGLDWNITGDKLMFTHDVSGYQDWQYRQLDTRILIYNFADSTIQDISNLSGKPLGSLDMDPQFAPNDAGIIFTNTQNDLISPKSVYFIDLNSPDSRDLLISNAEMPDYK